VGGCGAWPVGQDHLADRAPAIAFIKPHHYLRQAMIPLLNPDDRVLYGVLPLFVSIGPPPGCDGVMAATIAAAGNAGFLG
jgi:hypothetical protein